MQPPGNPHITASWQHAFGLLAALELGRWPVWLGPADEKLLRARVELLALLSNSVPRAELHRLDTVVASWSRQFLDRRPVSAADLRAVAWEALPGPTEPPPGSASAAENWLRVRAITGVPTVPGEAVAIPEPSAVAAALADAERQCALGLHLWFEELANHPRWRHLPALLTGEAPTDLDAVYVELYAVADRDAEEMRLGEVERPKNVARRLLAGQCPVVSVLAMIARTMQRCVVVGEPGGGKSTLIRWLARAVYRQQCPDFDAALVVKLSAFAAALALDRDVALLDFFFGSLGTDVRDWRPAVYQLQRLAGGSHRFLLLLDGWDEVPVPQREAVLERILAETPYFVTVVTSRPSGMPRQLCVGDRVDFYHIAGLAPQTADDLVRNLLAAFGRPDLFASIRDRIQNEADLRDMAANPFLLSLLVRILLRTAGGGETPRTLAEVYHRIADWLQEQHDQGSGRGDPITTGHLAALRRLSYELLFEGESSRYLFRGQELNECLGGHAPEPVRRSRFINRVDPDFDEYAFLHATFQEYFAAGHAARFAPAAFDQFAERAFGSASRLIVLEFVAGLGGRASARCRERAVVWFQERDRFEQVLFRVGRLAAAGRWPAEDEAGRAVRAALWEEIRRNRDMALTEAAVAVFAELDPDELARRAREAGELDNWAIDRIVDLVPQSVRRRERLDELLPGEWGDYAGFDVRGGATAAELTAIRADLVRPGLSAADRRAAVIHAGAVRDPGAVPALVALLDGRQPHDDLQEKVIDSLGGIGGRSAVDALVEIVIGVRPYAAEAVTQASGVLCHTGAHRKALDPVGRDRLVRRLATLPPDHDNVEAILAALEGYPLRDGAGLIDELARNREGSTAVRTQAIRVLATVTDRRRVQEILATIDVEPVGGVVEALLHLALGRGLYVPLDWLRRQLVAARDPRKRREWLIAYLLVHPLAVGGERERSVQFLDELVAEAFREDSARARELAEIFPRAVAQIERLTGRWFPEETLRRARGVLANFTESPESVTKFAVLLAVSLIGHFRRPATRVELRHGLDAALGLPPTSRHDPTSLAQSLANSLAEAAPGELLDYPSTCAPVESALRFRSVKAGWLVFADRILDAEGAVVARRGAVAGAATVPSAPADLKTLIEQLPEKSRRVLDSYWLMVKPGGPCEPHEPLPAIYAALRGQFEAGGEDGRTRYLDTLFPDALPAFETWRRALQRIERRFAGQPELLTLLRRLGLGRRRPT